MRVHFSIGWLSKGWGRDIMTKKNRPEDPGNPKFKPLYNISCSSQRAIILKHFSDCPRLSTIQARDEYGILHPCGRIMELRKKGHIIDTHWTSEPDGNGVLHRIGLYVYQGKIRGHHGK